MPCARNSSALTGTRNDCRAARQFEMHLGVSAREQFALRVIDLQFDLQRAHGGIERLAVRTIVAGIALVPGAR